MNMKEKNNLVSRVSIELGRHIDYHGCSKVSSQEMVKINEAFVRLTRDLLTCIKRYKQDSASRALKQLLSRLKRDFVQPKPL